MTKIRQPTRLPRQSEQHEEPSPIADAEPRPPSAQPAAAETAYFQTADTLPGRIAYSVAEAAFITGLSRDLLYAQMRVGNLDYLKVGRRRLITRRDLDHFLSRIAS